MRYSDSTSATLRIWQAETVLNHKPLVISSAALTLITTAIVTLFLLSPSPADETAAPAPNAVVGMAEEAVPGPAPSACAEQAWPYHCLAPAQGVEARKVRVIGSSKSAPSPEAMAAANLAVAKVALQHQASAALRQESAAAAKTAQAAEQAVAQPKLVEAPRARPSQSARAIVNYVTPEGRRLTVSTYSRSADRRTRLVQDSMQRNWLAYSQD